jgi:hypothetical protein
MDRRGFLGLLGMAGAYAAVPKTLRRLEPASNAPSYDMVGCTQTLRSMRLADASMFCVGDVVQLAYGPTFVITGIHGNDVDTMTL